jgi:hypothetical protein
MRNPKFCIFIVQRTHAELGVAVPLQLMRRRLRFLTLKTSSETPKYHRQNESILLLYMKK